VPKKTIKWSSVAEADLNKIIDYFLNKDEISIAENTYAGIQETLKRLENFPQSGRIIPELEEFNIFMYREIIYKRWRVLYKVQGNDIYILGVIDGRRNIEDILLERMVRD